MSNDKTQPTPGPILVEGSATDAAPKQNFFQRRIVTPIKNHPKIATAVGLGAVLVGGAALAGRKSAQYDVVLELQPAPEPDVETVTLIDTTVTD